MKTHFVLGGLLTALILAPAAKADTLTAACSADTWMLAEQADNNMGASTTFATGINAHGSAMRALLKFDLSSIPTNAIITDASLTLIQSAVKGSTDNFLLHRMLQGWAEGAGNGNQGTMAADGETTWNNRLQNVSAWGNGGGGASVDYAAAESASLAIGGDSSCTFTSTAGLVSDLQGWVGAPANNFGWLMKSQSEGFQSAHRWLSRESGSGPVLLVNYTVVSPAAQSPTIAQATRTNNQIHFTFNGQANRTYAVESRSDAASGLWSTAATFLASPVATNFTFSEAINSASNKFYRVRTP